MKMHLFKTAAVAAAAVAAFTFASAVHAAEISDTTQLYYNRLKTLGIVSETGDFDKTLTRGEMARIVCEVGRYNTVNSGGKIFSDVPEDHQYANYINAAYEHGIISGYSDGSFGPEDEVTREQMYKMLLSVAGYSVFAEQNGGYPSGYMSIASSNSLILKRSGSVTIEEAIYSTFKTIEMPVVKMTYAPNLKYEKDPEHTLLSVILDEEDMEIWDGVMSFDGITSINSDELPNENYMEIGGNRVANGGADAAGLLGKHVEYFVDDGGVCAVYEYPGKNREVTFSAEDINYASKQSYSVYLDGSSSRRTSLRLSGGLNVVYNRQGLEGWSEDDLIPSNGSVTLIDNNDDGDYDVAIVSDRRYYVVDSASSEGLSVRFKLYENQSESGYNINESDLGSSIYYYVTDSEGVRRDPSAVSKNSVIGVAKSRDGKIMDVVVTKKAVDGTLDALSDKSLTVNGISYDTIRIGAGEYPVFDVKPGDTVTIYINENDEIVYCEQQGSSESEFAFVKDVYLDDDGETWFVKLVTSGNMGSLENRKYYWVKDKLAQNSGIISVEVNRSLRINGEKSSASSINELKYQVVTYMVNSQDKLTSIDVLTPDFEYTEGKYNHNTGALVQMDLQDNTDLQYDNPAVLLTGNIQTLVVPRDPNELYSDTAYLAKYRIENGEATTNAAFYDIPDGSQTPRLLVLRAVLTESGTAQGDETNGILIKSVSEGIDSDGEMIYTATIYNNSGSEVTLTIRDDVSFTDNSVKRGMGELQIGDVIEASVDSNNKVIELNVMASAEQPVSGMLMGKVQKLQPNVIWNKSDGENFYNVFYYINSSGERIEDAVKAEYAIFKYENKKVDKIDANDIITDVNGVDADTVIIAGDIAVILPLELE